MVQRPTRRACGNILVSVCGGHGPGTVGAATRHVGQLPTVPGPQRLPADGRQPEERTLPSARTGHICAPGRPLCRPDGVLDRPVYP